MEKLFVSYAILFIAISPTRIAEATGVSVHDNASQGFLPTQRLYACTRFSKSPLIANTNECKGGTLKITDAVACAKAAEACGYRFGGARPSKAGLSYQEPTGCFVYGSTRRCRGCGFSGKNVYFNTAGSGGPSIYTAPLCLSACSTLASDKFSASRRFCLYRSDCRMTGSSCSDATCSSNRDCANGQSCDDGRCRSPTPSSKREAYAEMTSNTNVCTSGTSRILDPVTCTSAAEALGYRWLYLSRHPRRPQGCIVDVVDKARYVYFNTVSGASSARYAPICLASPTKAPPKAPPTEAPPTEAPTTTTVAPTVPPTKAPPTEAPRTDLLPYTGMTCETNDGYGRWRRSNACTAEILNSDVTTWADGSGVHFSNWAKIALASPVVLSSVEVFYVRGQRCDYDVQYSIDGTVWATVCSVTAATSGTGACAHDLPSAAVSYLRIHKPSQRKCSRRDAWFRLTGVKIFGREAQESDPTEAPPTEAPPTEAPPTEAPPTEAPPTEAPTTTTVAPTVPPTKAPTEARGKAKVGEDCRDETYRKKSGKDPTAKYTCAGGLSCANYVYGKSLGKCQAPPTEAPPTEAPPTEAPPSEAPPTEAPPTEQPESIVVKAASCRGNDCKSVAVCPSGLSVVKCEASPSTRSDGVYVSTNTCTAQGASNRHPPITAIATCAKKKVSVSESGPMYLDRQEVAASCLGKPILGCYCLSPWTSCPGGRGVLPVSGSSCKATIGRSARHRRRGVASGAGAKIYALCGEDEEEEPKSGSPAAPPTDEAPTFAPTTTVAPTETPTTSTVAPTVPPTTAPTEAPATTVGPTEAPTTIPTTTKAPPATSRRRRRRGRKVPARRRRRNRGRKGPKGSEHRRRRSLDSILPDPQFKK